MSKVSGQTGSQNGTSDMAFLDQEILKNNACYFPLTNKQWTLLPFSEEHSQ